MTNKKILVTGASGLLGSEIVKRSNDCHGLDSSTCNLLDKSLSSFITDSCKIVIHCASRVGGVKINSEKLADFFDDNIKINMNVFDSCKKRNVKLLSVMSTCIYPDAGYVSYPLTEDQLHNGPPHDSNFGYAYAKRMIDIQTKAYRRQFGCNFISVIPNNLYGINDNYDLDSGHVVPSLIRKFYEAKSKGLQSVEIWGSGRPLREFTYAKDAAQIILWFAENYDQENPVNIGNPEQVSIKQLSELIAQEVGYRGNINFNSNKPEGQYQKPSSNLKMRIAGCNIEYTPLNIGIRETVAHFAKMYPSVRGIQK